MGARGGGGCCGLTAAVAGPAGAGEAEKGAEAEAGTEADKSPESWVGGRTGICLAPRRSVL